MTVLEPEISSSLLQAQTLERLLSSDGSQVVVACPNINSLSMPHFQKADQLVRDMGTAILAESVETFNAHVKQLTSLLKKYAEPVTQWNPLVLKFSSPKALEGLNLCSVNLSMTRLCTENTELLSLDKTSLQGANFLCADLSHVRLQEADLSGADLRYADLRETNLEQAILIETDFSHSKLSFATLDGANLHSARLNSALMKQTNLRGCSLRKADLRNADLYQANLYEARLQYADLREANLFMANLGDAKLRHADLRKAHLGFCNFQGARLNGARLEDSNLTSANLEKADMQKCQFSGATLSRTNLAECKLSGAAFRTVDLSEALALETANVKDATFDTQTVFPKSFKPKKQGMINVCSTGLWGWIFSLTGQFKKA